MSGRSLRSNEDFSESRSCSWSVSVVERDGRRWVRSWRGTNDEHGDERRQRTVSGGYEKGDWQRGEQENGDPIKRRIAFCYAAFRPADTCSAPLHSAPLLSAIKGQIEGLAARGEDDRDSSLLAAEIKKRIDENSFVAIATGG